MTSQHSPVDLLSVHYLAALVFQAALATVGAVALIALAIAIVYVVIDSFKTRDWIAWCLLFIIALLVAGMVTIATDPNPATANPACALPS